MTELAEVHTIYESNARSISDMLRQSADSIELQASEDLPPTVAMVAVRLMENGEIDCYGWGDTSDIHAIGLLHLGLVEVARIKLGIPVG